MVNRVLRTVAAVALSLSWLVAAGPPATAAVTDVRVDTPKANDKIRKAVPLIVAVEWTQTPGFEDVGVRARLLDNDGDVVGCPPDADPECGILQLAPVKPGKDDPTESPSNERRFKGEIDPQRLAWLGGGVAPNGRYHLQYQWEEYSADGPDEDTRPDSVNRPEDWSSQPFMLDAPPPPQGTPVARMTQARNREVTVSWPANTAPDLVSYELQRRATDGEWTLAQADIPAGQTQTFDRVPDKGNYRYRVVAARFAGDPEDPPRTTVSMPSTTVEVVTLREKYGDPPKSLVDSSQFDSPVIGSGPPTTGTPQSSIPGPQFAAPADANQTYKGPLDYGVSPREVTERVPVDVAKGDSGGSALEVIDNAIDQERVLPPLAGGLILIVSAAHVLRYLNE